MSQHQNQKKTKIIRISTDIQLPQYFTSSKSKQNEIFVNTEGRTDKEVMGDVLVIVSSALRKMSEGKCNRITIKTKDETNEDNL
tara:strand:- start:309 stop:560 length:252 start_codon:yes stop_codon:yes gene_type:complete